MWSGFTMQQSFSFTMDTYLTSYDCRVYNSHLRTITREFWKFSWILGLTAAMFETGKTGKIDWKFPVITLGVGIILPLTAWLICCLLRKKPATEQH